MKIKIDGINEALKFARIAEKFSADVDITDGKYIVDGKSQMGILMICAEKKPLEASIHTDDTVTCGMFQNAIRDFLVTGE